MRKLSLHRETVRALTASDLGRVAGGSQYPDTQTQPTCFEAECGGGGPTITGCYPNPSEWCDTMHTCTRPRLN